MKKLKSVPEQNKTNKILPVVGIGVSAGGLDALKNFFEAVPSDTGAAFVVIQHLDPDHKSILADLLSRFTGMKVLQIVDGVEITANTIFIIPPGFDVSLENNKLNLNAQPRERTLRLPVDSFFKSLSQDKKDKAIGVILSGTGTDGALGVRDIKSENGVVFIQTPEDAKYNGMPVSAISTGVSDYILDAGKMSDNLMACIGYVFDSSSKVSITESLNNSIISNLFDLLQSKTGHDFSNYKPNTIKRRIERRMKIVQVTEIEDYISVLEKDSDELEALYKDFLIGVTSFFRDKDAFDSLNSTIIPEIFSQSKQEHPIRIWVPACSTGEEAYSIAILFREFIDKHSLDRYTIQIFASDIDKYAIDKARKAVYPESIAHDIPEKYLRKYFTHQNNEYVVNKKISDSILFAEQSVSKDPPFSKVDLISCRNLLIYLSNGLQEKVIASFHYALKVKGFLFLGTSETLGKNRDLFSTRDEKWKLYQKHSNKPNSKYLGALPSLIPIKKGNNWLESPIKNEKRVALKHIVERTILESFTPAAVLVNNKQDIVYLKGNTSAYLEPVEGIANMNLIQMAKPDIRAKLSIYLSQAISENKKVTDQKLHIKVKNTYKFINVNVLPIEEDKNQEAKFFLIVFEDITEKEIFLEEDVQTLSDKDKDYIQNLELELKQTKDRLQSVIEESEAKNEELKANNEEFQTANEELQSTNEELETSKEELQSINEELITLNSEHLNKIGELWDRNNDISNLLKSTEIATIFLDLDLKIKMFTPKVEDIIDLVEADIGRFIENFRIKLNYPEFLTDIKQVLYTLETIEKEVKGIRKCFICRIMPYRTVENEATGVVITLVEVTELKNAEQDLREYKNLLEKNSSIAKLGVWEFDLRTSEIVWSKETYKIFEVSNDYEPKIGSDIKFCHPDYQKKLHQLVENAINKREAFSLDHKLITDKGNTIWVRSIGEAIVENGETIKISGTIQNINTQKLSSEALKESEKKYKAIFYNVQAAILVADDTGKYLSVNDAACQLFGYSQDELLQMKAGDLKTADGGNVEDKYKDYIKKGIESGEFEFLTKDNKSRICQYIAIRPSQDFNISILMDITDQKKNQQKLKHSEAHLKELNATKDKFFSIIAHDLKSPFNSITGLAEILHEEATNYSAEQIQELSGLIYSSSKLAFKLLNNLLQWSRLQTGAIKPNFAEIKPDEVVSEVKPLLESSANSKNIQLKAEIIINDSLWADLDMVKTVLRNLISNALKFTKPEGEVMIETQTKGDCILFIVSDTGVGIKADQMENLFKINNKLSKIGTAKEKGTGLGLILCAEFIKLHGGQIWAESQLGEGSKFYFTLPKFEITH
jgi:two-component system CheB/CheR fusion protein